MAGLFDYSGATGMFGGGKGSLGSGGKKKKSALETFANQRYQSFQSSEQDQQNLEKLKQVASSAPKAADLPDTFTIKSKDGKTDVQFKKDDFLKQWDAISESKKKALFKVIQDQKAQGSEGAAIADATLNQAGKYKGGISDFAAGANDKLFGGLQRGFARTYDFVRPGDQSGQVDRFLKRIGADDASNVQYKGTGRLGQKVGSVEKGIVDLAAITAGAGAASKGVEGTSAIQKLSKGGQIAKTIASAAPNVAGSLAGTTVGAAQDIAAGNKGQYKKNALIGTAADLALPGLGKLTKVGDSAIAKGVSKLASEDGSRVLNQIGEKGLLGAGNAVIRDNIRKGIYKTSDLMGDTKVGSKIISTKDNFMSKWVDSLSPLYKDLKRSDFEGRTNNAYLTAREAIGNANRAASQAADFIDNNPNFKSVVEGVANKSNDFVKGRKAFDEYAKVRSELDLAKAGKKEFSAPKLAQLEERAAKAGDFSKEYDGLVGFYKDLNNFRLENGLISKQKYDEFANNPIDYIRQQRELPDWMKKRPSGGKGPSASISSTEATQKRNKFASSELLSPTETAIKAAQVAHAEALRNQAAKSVYDQLAQAGEAKIVKGAEKSHIPNISFLDNGAEKVVKVDSAVASAIKNWDAQSQNVMNNFLRTSNQIFKYGTTGMNVGFALPNLVADQVSSAINSKAVFATHNPVNMVRSFFITIGHPLGEQDAKVMQEFLRTNGGSSLINQYAKPKSANRVANDAFKQKGNKIYTEIKHPKEAMRSLYDTTESLIGGTEKLTRVQNFRGTYNKALKEGAGASSASKVASQAARENSVDFLSSGDYSRVVNSFIPYFNAGIQGTRTMARNAAERHLSFAAKTAALVGVPTVTATAWNLSDPDRKKIYDTIPDYVKENNFIIIKPGAKWNEKENKWDGVVLMKKPPGFKEFANPVQAFMEFKSNTDPEANKSFSAFIKGQGTDITKKGISGLSPVDITDPSKLAGSLTPQLLKPVIEGVTNQNLYTGQKLVPDYLKDATGRSVASSSLAPADQHRDQFSKTSQTIGRVLGVSPMKIDNAIKGYTGELGTNVQNALDRLSGAPDNAVGGRSLRETVSRRFSGAPGGADTNAFYSVLKPAQNERQRTYNQMKDLLVNGEPNRAQRIANEYNQSIAQKFLPFMKKYANSPTYDPKWDEELTKLFIEPDANSNWNSYLNSMYRSEVKRRQK